MRIGSAHHQACLPILLTGLQKEAKIEILDPELKKAMDAAAQASASEPSEDQNDRD
jgi:hypothetical protein